MSFRCVISSGEDQCENQEQGDTPYLLGHLTFCAPHQEAFEEAVSTGILDEEVSRAKLSRGIFGKMIADFKERIEAERLNPAPPDTRRDMRHEATVYFLRCDGHIKIGYSIEPHMRLRQIQSADGTKYPAGINCATASLIMTEPGGYLREQELHRRFKHLRTVGEWFTEAPELTEYIESLSKEQVA